MAKTHLEKTLTSLAGEFGVASQLCLRGYVASLTLKNYPEVDIFGYNPKNGKQVSISVKASLSGKFDSSGKINLKNKFVYVHIKPDNTLDFYIIPPKIILQKRKREQKKYFKAHPKQNQKQPLWLESYSIFRKFKDKWEYLELG